MGNLDLENLTGGDQPGKRSWLFYLLVFSFALDLASFGALAYFRRQDYSGADHRSAGPPLTLQELCRALPLKPEQCRQLRSLMPEHQKRRQDLRVELARGQRALWELLKQDSPSWPDIQKKIQEVSFLQTKMEEESVHLCLEFQKDLQAGQRVVYLKLLEQRLLGEPERRGEFMAPKEGRSWRGGTR